MPASDLAVTLDDFKGYLDDIKVSYREGESIGPAGNIVQDVVLLDPYSSEGDYKTISDLTSYHVAIDDKGELSYAGASDFVDNLLSMFEKSLDLPDVGNDQVVTDGSQADIESSGSGNATEVDSEPGQLESARDPDQVMDTIEGYLDHYGYNYTEITTPDWRNGNDITSIHIDNTEHTLSDGTTERYAIWVHDDGSILCDQLTPVKSDSDPNFINDLVNDLNEYVDLTFDDSKDYISYDTVEETIRECANEISEYLEDINIGDSLDPQQAIDMNNNIHEICYGEDEKGTNGFFGENSDSGISYDDPRLETINTIVEDIGKLADTALNIEYDAQGSPDEPSSKTMSDFKNEFAKTLEDVKYTLADIISDNQPDPIDNNSADLISLIDMPTYDSDDNDPKDFIEQTLNTYIEDCFINAETGGIRTSWNDLGLDITIEPYRNDSDQSLYIVKEEVPEYAIMEQTGFPSLANAIEYATGKLEASLCEKFEVEKPEDNHIYDETRLEYIPTESIAQFFTDRVMASFEERLDIHESQGPTDYIETDSSKELSIEKTRDGQYMVCERQFDGIAIYCDFKEIFDTKEEALECMEEKVKEDLEQAFGIDEKQEIDIDQDDVGTNDQAMDDDDKVNDTDQDDTDDYEYCYDPV